MQMNGVDIEVERKNIKNVHLSVYPPDGRVHISVPLNYPDSSIQMYILQKWVWIKEKQQQLTSYDFQPDRQYVSGEEHYFKGEKYRLKVNRMSTGAYMVYIKGDYIVLNIHEDTSIDNARQTLYQWYRQQLSPILDKLIAKWCKILGVGLNEWEIRLMASRWGSCIDSESKAYFNVELAKKPIDCIEYVVAHELTHLIEHNHNDRFHHLLDIHLPRWQELSKKLNEFPI